MILIPKTNIPNQKFSITINGYNFGIQLQTAKNLTLFSLKLNEEPICNSVRCFPNSQVFFNSSIDLGGIFYWRCLHGDYPHYTKFDTQDLLFINYEEMTE